MTDIEWWFIGVTGAIIILIFVVFIVFNIDSDGGCGSDGIGGCF